MEVHPELELKIPATCEKSKLKEEIPVDPETVVSVSRFENISRVMDKILSYVVAVLLVAMSVIVFGNVVSRYFLDATWGWYEEVSRFLLIWIVFLGAVVALIRGDHLSIDLLSIFCSPRICRMFAILTDLIVLAALAVMCKGAWDMAIDSLESGWLASSVPIPYGWVYMIGPVSAALMFVQMVIKTAGDLRRFKGVTP
jgi:TRAP-type transport system small permease protein